MIMKHLLYLHLLYFMHSLVWASRNVESIKVTKVRFFMEEACVVEWLTPQTPDLEVWGSSLAHHIVSLDKELYSLLSLFIQSV